jgi:UDP-N-acetyl-2-amino-2-deoxyglucuronate dehydrogenase
MSKIRFGIVGCGVISEWHGQVLKNLGDRAELVAVCDIVPERAKASAAKWGGTTYTSIDDLLKDERVDAVTIGTPSGLHADQAMKAIAAGKHVVVEKPIDVTLAKANALVEAARKSSVVVTSVSQNRYGHGILKLHEWLDQGKLGKLVYGESTIKWYRTQEYYDSGDWRGTWALDGGGALMNQGVHYADQLRWALGNPKTLTAYAATLAHNMEAEDVVSASIQFESGAIGTLTATTCAYPGFSTTLEIYGTEGSVKIADNELVIAKFKNGEVFDGASMKHDLESTTGGSSATSIGYYLHTCQFRDFLDAIEQKRSPWITPEMGRDAVELVLGVYRSAKTGMPVHFPLSAE